MWSKRRKLLLNDFDECLIMKRKYVIEITNSFEESKEMLRICLEDVEGV